MCATHAGCDPAPPGLNTILPPAIAHRVEQTLLQHAQWRGRNSGHPMPRQQQTLHAGASNFSVLVTDGHLQWVVRIDGINPALHGLNRQSEWHILQRAAAAGLGPAPRYFNPELGSLVYDYLPADPVQQYSVGDLAELVRGIHRLAPVRHRVNLKERIAGYEKRAHALTGDIARSTLAQGRAIDTLLTARYRPGNPLVLCHNDLLRSNRLLSGHQLRALDWEYAAMASPWYELAVISAGDDMPGDARDELVRHYLQRPPTAQESRELQAHVTIYRYLELLWYLTHERAVLSTAQYQHKLTQLRSAVAQLQ
ncbi:MAG: phosphotransferase [Gammaproteobacteria bacterium]|nr:phosphotransferase [Gammaproteobacteria bacterium]